MTRPKFGPGAYVVRFHWWWGLVQLLIGGGFAAWFVVDGWWRLPRDEPPIVSSFSYDAAPDPGDWVAYGFAWLGLVLFSIAAIMGLRNLWLGLRRVVAFAVAAEGVYWCPDGDPGKARWFGWSEITAIELWVRPSGETYDGGLALYGPASTRGRDGKPQPLVSEMSDGLPIRARRIRRAVSRFAPHVTIH